MRGFIRSWPWAFLACWLFVFAGTGLRARFTADDLRNLHVHLTPPLARLALSNLAFWSTAYRPMGGLFYVGIYHLFGFRPLPFRIGCFVLIAVNVGLLYRVCARLGGSREIGLLAALLDAYHAWFVDLYQSTGTIYELLCFTFYVGALDLYTRIRQQDRMPRGREWAFILILYVAALDSKELAVTLPLALACYELLWHRPRSASALRWLGAEGRGTLLTGALTIPYVIGKLTGPASLIENPMYRASISPGRYAGAFRLYLNVIFYQDQFFRLFPAAVLMAAMLALALWQHSRPLLFAWLFVLFSVLPFIFLPRYAGFFIYLPMLGWTLFAATAFAMAREKLAGRMPPWALFLAVAAVLAPLHVRESRKTAAVFETASLPTAEAIAAFARARVSLPCGAHVFFASDPFPAGDYSLLFLTEEFYHDPTLSIRRARDGARTDHRHWDAIFAWRAGDWVSQAAPLPPHPAARG